MKGLPKNPFRYVDSRYPFTSTDDRKLYFNNNAGSTLELCDVVLAGCEQLGPDPAPVHHLDQLLLQLGLQLPAAGVAVGHVI